MCKHGNNDKNGQIQGSVAENNMRNVLVSSSGRLPKRHDVRSLEMDGQEVAKWTS